MLKQMLTLLAVTLAMGSLAHADRGARNDREDHGDHGYHDGSFGDRESSETLVRILYQGILMRQPEPEALRNVGDLIRRMGKDRLPIIAGELASDHNREFLNLINRIDIDTVVDNMYLTFFQRSTLQDPAGRAYWVTNLTNCKYGRDQLRCLGETVKTFARSSEFYDTNVDAIVKAPVYKAEYSLTGALKIVQDNKTSRSRDGIYDSCMKESTLRGFTNDNSPQVYIALANGEQLSGRGQSPKTLSEACRFVAYNAKLIQSENN